MEEAARSTSRRRRQDFVLLALVSVAGLRFATDGSCRLFAGTWYRPTTGLAHRLAEHRVATKAESGAVSEVLLGSQSDEAEAGTSPLGLPPLSQRTYLVTGATAGIGRATVEMLAKEGCTILVHGRDEGRIFHTMDTFARKYRNATFDGYEADFTLMKEVKEMAQLIRERHPVIHGILHNAATMDGSFTGEKTITWEQQEHTMAVNALAPFLLTAELLPNLQASGAGRVIFSGSATMSGGEYLDDLDCERKWSGIHAYSLSKLADAMMAEEMHQRYGDPPRLTFHAIDTGMADTKLGRHGASWARGHRKGRSQTRLVLGTLPNPKTAKNSFKALTEDEFQETSGRRLESVYGAADVADADKRAFLWDELVFRTQAEWPVPPELLNAADRDAEDAAGTA